MGAEEGRGGRGREAGEVGEGGALGAGDEAVGEGGGGVGERVVEEVEAGGAEEGGVEAEDAGGTHQAVHAANPEPVEEPTLLPAAVAAFSLQGRVSSRRSGFRRWRVHHVSEGFRVLDQNEGSLPDLL